ncbi:MAG: hypothetical protein RL238_2543 [Actinomycetota bacterium]
MKQRVPYFQRPKPPHDWRWVVGIIGKTLICTGLLMFAFVAYQLWGTGIATARAQNDLGTQFEEMLLTTSSTSSTSTTTTTAPDDTLPQSTTTSTIPVAPADVLPQGVPVAQLKIPSIGLDWTVVEGVGVPDLKKGPGHFPETPLPGQLGNAAIAGHRTTYGQPFFNLDKVQPGDLIEVDTLAGKFVYRVDGSTVVSPAEYASVIPTVDPDTATLTLATCTPAYTARQRLIVKATLVPELSAGVMRPPTATTPEQATSTTVADTLPGDSVPDTTEGAATATTDIAPATTLVPAESSGESDTFEQGWFHDTGAIPQVIVWALLLTAVVVGAFLIGKWSERLWVAFVMGSVPFVIVLYFFFENVNRLLPPGI